MAGVLVGRVQGSQDVEAAATLGLDEQADLQLDVVHEASQHPMSHQVGRRSCICHQLLEKVEILRSCSACKQALGEGTYSSASSVITTDLVLLLQATAEPGNSHSLGMWYVRHRLLRFVLVKHVEQANRPGTGLPYRICFNTQYQSASKAAADSVTGCAQT